MFAFDVWIGDVPSWSVRLVLQPRTLSRTFRCSRIWGCRDIIAGTFCLWRDQKMSVHQLFRYVFSGYKSRQIHLTEPVSQQIIESSANPIYLDENKSHHTRLPCRCLSERIFSPWNPFVYWDEQLLFQLPVRISIFFEQWTHQLRMNHHSRWNYAGIVPSFIAHLLYCSPLLVSPPYSIVNLIVHKSRLHADMIR